MLRRIVQLSHPRSNPKGVFMKTIILMLATVLSFSTSFAGSATVAHNAALGFSMTIQATGGDRLTINNSQNEAVEFDLVNSSDEESVYQEINGRCQLSIKHISFELGEGKTKNEFMLEFSGYVVQIQKGEDNCKLGAKSSGPRSLTGIYQ